MRGFRKQLKRFKALEETITSNGQRENREVTIARMLKGGIYWR